MYYQIHQDEKLGVRRKGVKGDTRKSGAQGLACRGREWEGRAVLHSSSPQGCARVLAKAALDARVIWDQADTALKWLAT